MAHAPLINEKQPARNTGFMHLRLYLGYFSRHMPIKTLRNLFAEAILLCQNRENCSTSCFNALSDAKSLRVLLEDALAGYSKMERAQADEIAICALSYIASDEALLPRFLDLSGIKASEIREASATPGFLAGVLQFILAHEPTLMAFSAATDIPPQRVAAALRGLPFGDENWDHQP